MESYRITHFGQPLEAMREPNPEPQGTEVLLRVQAAGVCHSDVHLWDGFFDLGGGRKLEVESRLPLTLGHETAGEVVGVGPRAEGIKIGDKRVIYPWIGCGTCDFCKRGTEHLCAKPQQLGIQRNGGYADHIVVPHPRYLLDYGALPVSFACTLACSGLTAYSALKRAGRLSPESPLLIIGAGGVGMAAVRLAEVVTGAKPIVADVSEEKLAAAKAAGAESVLDIRDGKAAGKALYAKTGGVVSAIDFVGAEPSFEFGQRALRKGGRLVVVGLFGGAFTMPIPMLPMRAIAIEGSYVGSLADMRELMSLAREGKIQPIPLSLRTLAQAGKTLEDLKAGRVVGRVVLTP